MRWMLVDGFNLVFRSHFAMERSNLRRQSDQFPTGALHGWIKSLQDLREGQKPDRSIVFFDLGGSDRHLTVLPDYKGQRDDTPEDIVLQLPEIKKLTALLGFEVVEKRGVEADDLIATAVKKLSAQGHECIIVSADKDFGQCVGGLVTQLAPPPTANPALGWRHLDASGVEEKFGVPPQLIADYLALVGDTSDNIPGLKGVGPKTAVKWLKQYGGLEAILNSADTIEPARFAEQIKSEANRIRTNLDLVRFQTHFELELNGTCSEDTQAVAEFLLSMEMHSTLRRYQTKHGLSSIEVKKKNRPRNLNPIKGSYFNKQKSLSRKTGF
jgi:DNA polymerase-1